MNKAFLTLRAAIFYLGYWATIGWFSVTGWLFFSFLPYRVRSPYLLLWNRFIIWWCSIICGLRFEVIGKENIPEGSFVALCKHQSQWETFFLQYYLAPVSLVLKKELMRIPFFGWGLALAKPIAINRNSPKEALKKTQKLGVERLQENISVLIFPEGTRVKPGEVGNYARGGANIAIAADAPVVPIAHNSGGLWPANGIIKYPGKITVVIGEPIVTTGRNSREITNQAKEWIEGQVAELYQQDS